MIIFYHIPKTGGTNFVNVIKNNYPLCHVEEEYNMVNPKGEIEAAWGHFSFEKITPESKIFVLLRDPVERVISDYWENKRNNYLSCSLEDLAYGRYRNDIRIYDFWENYYCRCFTENCIIKNDNRRPDRADMAVAMFNLERGKLVYNGIEAPLYFGITEQLEESIKYFAKIAGWKRTDYVEEDITRAYNKDRCIDVNPETEKKIRELNQLDQQIYNFAVKEFNEKIK